MPLRITQPPAPHRPILKLPAALLCFCLALLTPALAPLSLAQSPAQSAAPTPTPQSAPDPESQPSAAPTPTISSSSTLVLVPALVRNKSGQLIFTLQASDFVLTDDGVPQPLHLESDTGGEPLALVVDIDGGGAGAEQIFKDSPIASMLDSLVGGVPHRIAVVGYDSSPVLVTDFTTSTDAASAGIEALIHDANGDSGAATLDSLGFSIDLLRKQPLEYRRAILLIAESHDRGSKLSLDDALHAISDTNTAIYAIGFSTGRSETGHEAAKLSQPDTPGPAHGCMSRDPNDPNVDLSKNPAAQAFDCLALLAPPLRLATIAYVAARDALQRNIPESVARLTGGEYFNFGSEKNLERDLHTISNHIPNRYILSFQPQSPRPGFHSITLTAPGYTGLQIAARNGYWVDAPATPASHP